MVGMTRFERATPSSQAKCATKLRYIPTQYSIFTFGRSLVDISIRLAELSVRTRLPPFETILNRFSGVLATSRHNIQFSFLGRSLVYLYTARRTFVQSRLPSIKMILNHFVGALATSRKFPPLLGEKAGVRGTLYTRYSIFNY